MSNHVNLAIRREGQTRSIPVRSCGKLVFESRREARKFAKGARGRPGAKPGVMHPYWCEGCAGWHNGHGRLARGGAGNAIVERDTIEGRAMPAEREG